MDLRQAITKRRMVGLSELILEGHPDQIAAEGILDTVAERFRNFFERKEKEIHEEINHGEANLNQIATIQAMMSHKSALREDPTTIRLGAYAKWICIHGREINNPEAVIKELQRIKDLALLFQNAYLPAMNRLFDYMSGNLMKTAFEDPIAALDDYELNSPDFFPKEFKKILVKQRKGQLGNTITDILASENYMGDWYVGATTDPMLTKARLDIELHYDLTIKKPKEVYLLPYSMEEVTQALALVSEIAQITMNINKMSSSSKSMEKLYYEMNNLEKKYKNWDSDRRRSASEKAIYDCMNIAYTALWEVTELTDACTVFDHICRVVLKICEHSTRRMI